MDEGGNDTVKIEVSKVLVDQAEEAGLNVARVVEKALRDAMRRRLDEMSPGERDALRDKLRQEIEPEIQRINDHAEQHGLFADRWRQF